MAKKKTRKVGLIGVRKLPKEELEKLRKSQPSNERVKKHKGKPAGNKQAEGQKKKPVAKTKASAVDPRLGSKKPIALIAEAKPKINKPRFFSPAQELEAIENDKRLEQLIAKLEQGKKITTDEQRFVDEKLARHQQLCKMLGIENVDDLDEEDDDADLLERFEQSDLNEYRK